MIAIAGGIGSGKSVVSAILRVKGYDVYDCDSEAKRLMNTSVAIKNDLIETFGNEAVTPDGTIDSKYISSVVFKDKSALSKINSIVHPRVKEDILERLQECKQDVLFVETAILLQSNLVDVMDDVWLVTAPEDVRVLRVMNRNSMSADDVKKRIAAQQNQDYSILPSYKTIVNDDIHAVLPQVDKLVDDLENEINGAKCKRV